MMSLRQPNALRVSRAATFPKRASIRSASHSQFWRRYQTATEASDRTRLLGAISKPMNNGRVSFAFALMRFHFVSRG